MGAYCTLSSSSRVSSTRVREAASTSIRSTLRPASISRQLAHSPQGVGADAALAVQALGQDARHRGLADTARAGEQEGMMHAAAGQRIGRARAARAPARSFRQSCAAAICEPVRYRRSCNLKSLVREVIRTSRNFGTRPRRYRCSLPGLTGFTVSRREGTGADHHGPVGGEGGIRTHEHP